MGPSHGIPGQGHGSAPLLNPRHSLGARQGLCLADVSCGRAIGNSAAPINECPSVSIGTGATATIQTRKTHGAKVG